MAAPPDLHQESAGHLRFDQGMAACWWRTFFPALALFLVTAAFIITKTGRDALYFQQGGVGDLPKAYLLITVLAAPAAGLTLWLMRLCGPRRARVVALLAMAAAQAALAVGMRPGGGWGPTIVFAAVAVFYGVLLSLTWLLGADLLDLAPRYILARLYATMGASSMLGGLAGAALARQLSLVLDGGMFFAAGAAGLVLAALVCAASHRAFPAAGIRPENDLPMPSTPDGAEPSMRELLGLLNHRYVALLAAVGVATSIVGVLIEFQFYSSAASANYSSRESLRRFSEFYIALNAGAVVLQVAVTPAIQRRFGVHASLFVLPSILLGLAGALTAGASFALRTGLRIAEGGIKSSIHRSNWEQAYLPLQRPMRPAAKILVDGVAARTGEGTAAGLLLLSMSDGGAGLDWLSYVLVAGSTVWLALTVALRRSRHADGLIHEGEEDYRPDLPIPDG